MQSAKFRLLAELQTFCANSELSEIRSLAGDLARWWRIVKLYFHQYLKMARNVGSDQFHLNEFIADHLAERGYSSTLRSFKNDVKNDKTSSVMTLLRLFVVIPFLMCHCLCR